MMSSVRSAVVVAAGFVLLLAYAPVSAQGRTTAELAVRLATIYDDNIFWRRSSVADRVWRASPELRITRETARATWFTTVLTDAELYELNRDLSTPIARQQAFTQYLAQTTPAGMFTLNARSETSVNAADINTLTGLHLGRVRAWRWSGGPEYAHRVLSRTTLVGGYDLRFERAETEVSILSNTGLFRVEQDVSELDLLRGQYVAEHFRFEDTGTLLTHRATLGWSRQLTPSVSLSMDGGVRFINEDVRPEVEASLVRTFEDFDARLIYAWTHATALGAVRPVEVQRVTGTFQYSSRDGLGVGLEGGYYSNRLGPALTGRTSVYRAGLSVVQRLFGPVGIAASFALDYQSSPLPGIPGVVTTPPIVTVAKPTRVGPRTPRGRTHEELRRRSFAIQLVFAGPRWQRDDLERRREERERPGGRGPGEGGRE
jgi:hypothetical protein